MCKLKSHLLVALLTFGIGIAITSVFIFSAQVPEIEVFDNSNKRISSNLEIKLDNADSDASKKTFIETKGLNFEDYPVNEIYKGKNAPLKLTRADKFRREQLQWTIDNSKVDFAGHYILSSWSCGMWCSATTFIDAKNGKVYESPVTTEVCLPHLDNEFVCDGNFTSIEHRIDSKLIVFFGFRYDENNSDGKKGFHYYKFENGRFIHLKSILVKEQRSARQIQIDEFDEKNK